MLEVTDGYLQRVWSTEDFRAHTVLEASILRAGMLLAIKEMEELSDDLPELEYDEDEEVCRDEDGNCYDGDAGYTDWAYVIFDDDIDMYLSVGGDEGLMEDIAEESDYALSSWDEPQFY